MTPSRGGIGIAPERHASIGAGTFSTWPVWGGGWKWAARLNNAARSGTAQTGREARSAAIEALAGLNREKVAARA